MKYRFLEYSVKWSQGYLHIELVVDFSITIASTSKCLNCKIFGGRILVNFSEKDEQFIIQGFY